MCFLCFYSHFLVSSSFPFSIISGDVTHFRTVFSLFICDDGQIAQNLYGVYLFLSLTRAVCIKCIQFLVRFCSSFTTECVCVDWALLCVHIHVFYLLSFLFVLHLLLLCCVLFRKEYVNRLQIAQIHTSKKLGACVSCAIAKCCCCFFFSLMLLVTYTQHKM